VDESFGEFLRAMKDGPCYTTAPITAIPDYYNAVVENLRAQGYSGQSLNDAIRLNLRGICPDCCAWQDSTGLFMPYIVREEGKEHFHFSNYGSISRMVDGCCPNFGCNARNIVIIWKGDPNIGSFVNKMAYHHIGQNSEAAVNCFLRPEVLNYVADAIWLQENKGSPLHLYTGHKTREGDLQIWVSVMQWLPAEDVKRGFSNGYTAFLNQLLTESKYGTETISVMHWIYGCESDQHALYLAFVNRRNGQEKVGDVLFPSDLLNESERARFLGR